MNEVLKRRLNEMMELRDEVISEQANYMRLQETVAKIKGKRELKTKVDLGCNFFVEGTIFYIEYLFYSFLQKYGGVYKLQFYFGNFVRKYNKI